MMARPFSSENPGKYPRDFQVSILDNDVPVTFDLVDKGGRAFWPG
jgi:hypothetical protein